MKLVECLAVGSKVFDLSRKGKRRQKFRSKARRETNIVVAIVIVIVVNIDVDAVTIRADQLIAQTLQSAPPIDPVRGSHG